MTRIELHQIVVAAAYAAVYRDESRGAKMLSLESLISILNSHCQEAQASIIPATEPGYGYAVRIE